MVLRRAREAAQGWLVLMLLDRETSSDDRITVVWRAHDPSPRDVYNAQRRLARLLRKVAAEEET
jgi:ferric-dicitrate binding protein FerR (iron transport regulator)